MSKIVFKGVSTADFFMSLLLRAACIVFIAYLAFNYYENPPVIIVLILICFLFFLFIGNDEIIIYQDKVVQIDTSIFDFVTKSKGKVYDMKSIKSASIPIPESKLPNLAEVGLIVILATLVNRTTRRSSKESFYLDFKNGETVEIESYLDPGRIMLIVKTINSLVS